MSFKRVAFLISITCALTLPVRSGDAPEVRLKTVAVAAFKNGLGFFVRQGDVSLNLGEGRIEPVPAATLGSLWIAPNDSGTSLEEAVAYRYKASGQRNLISLAEVLRVNPGKTVTVVLNTQKEITGEIVGLREADRPEPEPVQPPSTPYGEAIPPYRTAPAASSPPDFLLLRVENKLLVLQTSSINQVVLPADAVLDGKQDTERKALRFRVKGATTHANLTIGYLQNGLGWTPSYLISLQDEKTAQITMQAVVTNDAEDLKDTDVFFVVGVPNFAYSNLLSPMALQQNLLEFMRAASRDDRGRGNARFSNAIMGQATISMDESMATPLPSFGAVIGELAGAPEEDLFLYTRGGVNLARGERGTYNVFSGSVGYEHVYEWDVPDASRVDGFGNVRSSNDPSDAERNAANNIWHSVRLKNSTKFPWTSAPAMVISTTKPVAQDTLPYTPKGAVSNLKLTIATDIRASREEREVSRQENTPHRPNYRYDLVTIDGTLKVRNYKAKEVPLQIQKTLRGTVVSASNEGKAEKLAEGIQADNPNSRLTWHITLKPGEERILTYQYKIWLAR
jgi:hypothetical protein